MDCRKVGALIFSLRKEKGLTQRQLADTLNVSDKTISKWERGLGCPDITLLNALSDALHIDVEKILAGELEANTAVGGNMKKIQFFMCPGCGNILTATGGAEISCCGRKLTAMVAKPSDLDHELSVETIEDDFYIRISHEMTKQHYISFVAYVTHDRFLLVKLYPEQNAEVRFPRLFGGKLYICCSQHGLCAAKMPLS